TRRRAPSKPKHEITIASAIVTFWCIETEPGGAPINRPIWSPTVSGRSHQPSSHARTPREFQAFAYSSTRSSTAAGIAPSEWLIRYVVSARIGKCSRYSSSSVTAREYRDALSWSPEWGNRAPKSPLGVIQRAPALNTVGGTTCGGGRGATCGRTTGCEVRSAAAASGERGAAARARPNGETGR